MSHMNENIEQIWQEALGVQVAPDTNFFEAGGHSFLAMRVIARIGDRCGFQVDLATLIDNPRLSDFLTEISVQQDRSD